MLMLGLPILVCDAGVVGFELPPPLPPRNATAMPAAAAPPIPIHSHFLLWPLAPVLECPVVLVIVTLGTDSPRVPGIVVPLEEIRTGAVGALSDAG
jgi:hypothetical protein